MRPSALHLLPLAAALALVGCHSSAPPTPQPQPQSTVSQPSASQDSGTPAPWKTTAPVPAITRHPKQRTTASVQDTAQLDLNSEGGVRGGNYALWVHVSRHGKPLKNINVVAFNGAKKLVASSRTNEDGDALLKVQRATYKIAAITGRAHAERTVTFHPGDQFELVIQR